MRRRFCVLLAFTALAGCSLLADLGGLSEPYGPEAGSDASSALSPDAGTDAPADAPVQPDGAKPCVPATTIDSTFGANLGDWRALQYRLSGYPKVEPYFGSPAAVLFPKITVPAGAGTDGGP